MIEHQVIDILKSFSNEEIKQFRRFLDSPYFNRSENVAALFELLIKFHPNFTSKKLTKEYVSENIFGQENYVDSSVRNLLSDLLNSCEVFMMQENFRKSALLSFDYLLKELREKKLSSIFQRNSEKLDNKYSLLQDVDSEYYLAKHKIELNKFNYAGLNEKITEGLQADEHIKEIYLSSVYLTIHYVIEIISLYLAGVFYAINYNRKLSEIDFLKKAISQVNLEGLQNLLSGSEHKFIVDIYIALMKMLEDFNNEEAYSSYKILIQKHAPKMDKDEAWFHYNNMTNYCTLMQIQTGDYDSQKYNMEIFGLYEDILKNEYYKNKKVNYLRFEYFNDILNISLRLKKMNWAENFIITYGPKLHKSDKDNMMNLAYMYLYYEKGEYMKSWKYLNKITIDYFFYKYDLKNYALKIYFDLGYHEEALTLIEAYKKFLNRNDMIPDNEKNRIKNFISYLSKLILFKAGQLPAKHFSTYRRRLGMTIDTISHRWIMQKYEEQALLIRDRRKALSA